MPKSKSKIQDLLSAIVLITAIALVIGIAGYYAGTRYKEYIAAKKLKSMLGFLPGDNSSNRNAYSRKLDFYTVSQNTPNFRFEAYDADFRKCSVTSDSNGFLTGDSTLTIKKPEGTIRIFITGGSGAFGTIQAHNEVDDTYPSGTYNYEVSIAGCLKKDLESEFPGQRFEVVNAAVVQHLFNQNYAMYFEKIHDFKPDIIISLDGWNDAGLFLFSKHQGNPYQMTGQQADENLTLELLSRYCSSYSSILDNIGGLSKRENQNNNKKPNIPFVEPMESDYKKVEPIYIKNSQKLLWLYYSYLQQLKNDSVFAIVSLQPMLERREMNKKLSPLELKFRNIIERREFQDAYNSFNDIITNEDNKYVSGAGNEKYNIVNFMDAFFFDKYFSEKLGDEVNRAGFPYIDVGKEIENMDADKEFFVDYCHTTPYGNQVIAKLFAHSVSEHLHKIKKL